MLNQLLIVPKLASLDGSNIVSGVHVLTTVPICEKISLVWMQIDDGGGVVLIKKIETNRGEREG